MTKSSRRVSRREMIRKLESRVRALESQVNVGAGDWFKIVDYKQLSPQHMMWCQEMVRLWKKDLNSFRKAQRGNQPVEDLTNSDEEEEQEEEEQEEEQEGEGEGESQPGEDQEGEEAEDEEEQEEEEEK